MSKTGRLRSRAQITRQRKLAKRQRVRALVVKKAASGRQKLHPRPTT